MMLGRRHPVCAHIGALDNRESTMHRARVQLHRLRHTYGEPEREQSGETAQYQVRTHSSNIGRIDDYGRSTVWRSSLY
jgi:hypothetical protein